MGKHLIEPKDLIENNCSYTNCVITTEHLYLSDITMYDAIVFHTARDWHTKFGIPNERHHNQIYILYNLEPPYHSWHNLKMDENFYNWTMTYRLDSDVVIPYGTFKTIKDNYDVNIFEHSTIHLDYYDEELYQKIIGKTKKIAWFVSNCNAPSRRDKLADEINKYITVDIYGKCGKFECPRTEPNKCDALLENEYKFYLSFENELCQDYVTEKFFNVLKFNIIPIVFGGGNYTKFAPIHSYIDANQFNTTEALTTYLIYLDDHPMEYIKYFWWKKKYKSKKLSILDGFCKLCERLTQSTQNNYEHSDNVYQNIDEWWNHKDLCGSSKIQF